MDASLAYQFLAALLAILNPLGNVPVFLALTSDSSPAVRRTMAVLVSSMTLLILLLFFLLGNRILGFFGISMPAFRIAGGILILLVGIGMVMGRHAEPARAEAQAGPGGLLEEAERRLSSIVVPLVVPIIAGPGAMATAVLYGDRATGASRALLVGAMAAACLVLLVVLAASDAIGRRLGRQGLQIASRVLGIVLTAIGVQFILAGLGASTIDLINLKAITG
jgi:multiple antibiotic resistance protein